METANHGPWDGITRRGGRKVAIIGAGNVGRRTDACCRGSIHAGGFRCRDTVHRYTATDRRAPVAHLLGKSPHFRPQHGVGTKRRKAGLVLLDHPGVLHRHLPATEVDQAGVAGDVIIEEGRAHHGPGPNACGWRTAPDPG